MQLGALAAPLEQLLSAGGGSRLEVDPATGLNAYGCAPRPRIEALAFGSSTASTISPQAYAAADALRQELIGAARTGDLDPALAQAMAAIRRGILDVCGAADLAGVEVVLTPSGTDGEYAALHLARGGSRQPIVNIVIAPEETGSGVLAAAQGRHFARVTPSGAAARPDAAIAGLDPELIQVPTVPIRGSDGQPRPLAEIDAEVAALVEQAIAAGRRCLVHVLAGSKTGLLAPSFDAAQKLTRVRRRRGRRPGRRLSDAAAAGAHPRLPRGGLDGPGDRLEILRRAAVRRRTAGTRAESSHARPGCRRCPRAWPTTSAGRSGRTPCST